jgi:hypothetical protein
MSERHDTIGIKQVIRYEWMEKTSSMLLAGMDEKSIRKELNDYLLTHRGTGSEEQRSENTCKFVVNILMKIWVSPDKEIIPLRNSALSMLNKYPSQALAIHWAMISTAYPFWYNVALNVGRLLNLQEKITHQQVINRLKEQYGDRQTISRYARYVIRSLVAWGVLKDSECKGCYERVKAFSAVNKEVSVLLCESTLYAVQEGKGSFKMIVNSPACFPFQVPLIEASYVSRKTNRIDVVHYGTNEEFLQLKEK